MTSGRTDSITRASAPIDAHSGGAQTDLAGRLVDGFFRRWFWYLVPVVAFGVIGVYIAGNVATEYEAGGTVNASANPLVDQPESRSSEFGQFESPAAGTARLINEQLGTDAFVDEVAARAGLTDALTAGAIGRDEIRGHVGASADGDNILTVSATWGDAQTSFLLVDSTINGYLDYVADEATSTGDEAAEFWTQRKQQADARADDALDDLNEYVSGLDPLAPGQEQPLDQVLATQRLNGIVDQAQTDVSTAQAGIYEAELTAEQARSAAVQTLRVVDPPEVPTEPNSELLRRMLSVVAFLVVGVLVAFFALLFGTITDRSVRSRTQLALAAGSDVTTVIPHVKSLRATRRQRRSRARSIREAA